MKPKLYTCTIPLNNQNLNVVFTCTHFKIPVYMLWNTYQSKELIVTLLNFISLFFFFYIHNPTFAEINKFLIFLNTCTYIINSSIIFILNGMDLALVFGIKKKKLLHYTTCTFSGVKNTVLKTTMILIKNQYNQMYKLTCTCTKEM